MSVLQAATFEGFDQYKLTGIEVTDHVYGHGSYASVIEVNYGGLKCAGKKIHEVLLAQGNMTYTVRRFEEECHLLSNVRHPNVVQFLGVHFQEGEQTPILVMEFLPNNLSQCIEQYDILPKEIGYSILYDVAKGLCYLHNQSPSIIHRDLSSNNVLLTHDMTAKISDLGMARILNLPYHQFSRMTQSPGTPAFMPPEVMVAKPKYNTSVDEFSFGMMMIHMLSGKWPEPHIGPTRTQDGKLIPVSEAERREVFLTLIGKDHPLMDLIQRCIHNDPSMRAHADELVWHLAISVRQFPATFVNRLEMLKRIRRDEEEKTQLREQVQQMRHDNLAQGREFGNEIELLRQQNDELHAQNRALMTENENLLEQVMRDDETMVSTMELLQHTLEQKRECLARENSTNNESEHSQALQVSEESNSKQDLDQNSQLTPVNCDSTQIASAEPKETVTKKKVNPGSSSWITRHVQNVQGLFTTKQQVR